MKLLKIQLIRVTNAIASSIVVRSLDKYFSPSPEDLEIRTLAESIPSVTTGHDRKE